MDVMVRFHVLILFLFLMVSTGFRQFVTKPQKINPGRYDIGGLTNPASINISLSA